MLLQGVVIVTTVIVVAYVALVLCAPSWGNPTDKPFVCDHCGQSYADKRVLVWHHEANPRCLYVDDSTVVDGSVKTVTRDELVQAKPDNVIAIRAGDSTYLIRNPK